MTMACTRGCFDQSPFRSFRPQLRRIATEPQEEFLLGRRRSIDNVSPFARDSSGFEEGLWWEEVDDDLKGFWNTQHNLVRGLDVSVVSRAAGSGSVWVSGFFLHLC